MNGVVVGRRPCRPAREPNALGRCLKIGQAGRAAHAWISIIPDPHPLLMNPPPSPPSDVLQRARAGDRAAFAELVVAYQHVALRVATVVCGDPTEAADIVQDSFVRAHQALPTLRSDAAFRGWLLRAVANQAKNARRSTQRRQRRHLRLAATVLSVESVEDSALRALQADALLVAIGRLTEREREVLAYRYFAGLGEQETAEMLGIAAGTVKSRTARALASLRAIYQRSSSLAEDDR